MKTFGIIVLVLNKGHSSLDRPIVDLSLSLSVCRSHELKQKRLTDTDASKRFVRSRHRGTKYFFLLYIC